MHLQCLIFLVLEMAGMGETLLRKPWQSVATRSLDDITADVVLCSRGNEVLEQLMECQSIVMPWMVFCFLNGVGTAFYQQVRIIQIEDSGKDLVSREASRESTTMVLPHSSSHPSSILGSVSVCVEIAPLQCGHVRFLQYCSFHPHAKCLQVS